MNLRVKILLEVIHPLLSFVHRVDRLLGFFSSRPNWDPSHPQESVFHPPLVPGGGTHSLAGEGGGEGSQLRRGDRHCGTLDICGFVF